MMPEREQRDTFRVTVRPKSGVAASVHFAGHAWPASVGDISAEGIFVKLERGGLAALKAGSFVDVEVRYEDEAVSLFGEIRVERAGGYGIHFPARDPAGRPNPLDKFGRVSAQLQRLDLSQCLKVLKLPEAPR